MKKIALSLGFATLAVAGAQAADLPFAEPVEYVKVCDTYGKGYFYIPGTDTCLNISGLVRVDLRYEDDDLDESNSEFITDTRSRLRFDARSETEWGTLRSYIEYEGRYDTDGTGGAPGGDDASYDDGDFSTALRQGYIQFAGLTVGKVARSFYDYVPYQTISDLFSDEQVLTVAYTAKIADAFSATIGIEDKAYRADPTGIGGLDQVWPNVIGALSYKGGWGDAQVSAAVQDNQGDNVFSDDSDDLGWAVQAGLSINLPSEVKGSKVWAIGAYTEGALSYTGSEDYSGTLRLDGFGAGNYSDATIGGGDVINTEAWTVGGGASWAWSKTVTTNVAALYTEIDQAFDDDMNYLLVEGNVYWKPVSGLNLALAVIYGDTEVETAVGGGTATPPDDDHLAVITRLERSF